MMAILAFASESGAIVVAEGIEDASMLSTVRAIANQTSLEGKARAYPRGAGLHVRDAAACRRDSREMPTAAGGLSRTTRNSVHLDHASRPDIQRDHQARPSGGPVRSEPREPTPEGGTQRERGACGDHLVAASFGGVVTLFRPPYARRLAGGAGSCCGDQVEFARSRA